MNAEEQKRMFEQAKAYMNGKGVEENKEKGFELYGKLAQNGYVPGMTRYGRCFYYGWGCQKDYKQAFYWLNKASELGDADAWLTLGHSYILGDGVEKDFEKAAEFYQKSADAGNAEAMNNIGICYLNGEGVEENINLATYWFEKGANAGDEEAQYNIAISYRDNGDIKNSFKYFKMSAENGYVSAYDGVGKCYLKGEGTDRDEEKAVYWFEKGVENNDPHAMVSLADCYEYGYGVKRNTFREKELLLRAQELGSEAATARLKGFEDESIDNDASYENVGNNTKAEYYAHPKSDGGFKKFICSGFGRAILILAMYVVIFALAAALASSVGGVGVLILMAVLAVFGWQALTKITPKMFVWMSCAGWVAYFVIKAILSVIVGFIVTPFVITKKIRNSLQNSSTVSAPSSPTEQRYSSPKKFDEQDIESLKKMFDNATADYYNTNIDDYDTIDFPCSFCYNTISYQKIEIRQNNRLLCPHCGEMNRCDTIKVDDVIKIARSRFYDDSVGTRDIIEIPCPNCKGIQPFEKEYDVAMERMLLCPVCHASIDTEIIKQTEKLLVEARKKYYNDRVSDTEEIKFPCPTCKKLISKPKSVLKWDKCECNRCYQDIWTSIIRVPEMEYAYARKQLENNDPKKPIIENLLCPYCKKETFVMKERVKNFDEFECSKCKIKISSNLIKNANLNILP